MNEGKYVFSQIIETIYRYEFITCVEKYNGDYKIRSFSCWDQFLAMSLGQLGKRESLRDIVLNLEVHKTKLYHLGFRSKPSKSTLADANENRNSRIYEEFAYILIEKAKKLYTNDKAFNLELDGIVYALDSTTIDLCMTLFPWAKFRKTKSGIKLHTLLSLKGNIPSFIHITAASVHDVNILEILTFEVGAYYIMDRGYLDFKKLHIIHDSKSFFVTRTKKNTKLKRLYSKKIRQEEKDQGIRSDQTIILTATKSRKDYPDKLRKIKYFDKETKHYYVFITNNFILDAKIIAGLYKQRWQVELFFKWIKQNLKIQRFFGYSENAVKIQVWIAISIYVVVAIIKKTMSIEKTMNEILQILSLSLFDKTQLNSLLQTRSYKIDNTISLEPPSLFDP